MGIKAILGFNLIALISICASAQEPVYNRAAARAEYFRQLVQNANPAVAQQIKDIKSNPTYLPNGAQDNAGMRRQIRDVTIANDPNHAVNLERSRAAALAPYIGRPGRPMDESEIPDFDSNGYYSVPGFGRVQVPLTQEQMALYNEARVTGRAPASAGAYLRMLGISPSRR